MTDQPIVPSFGDDDAGDRKLAIICSKGNLDMAYPGLILGNAALGEGVVEFGQSARRSHTAGRALTHAPKGFTIECSGAFKD